MRKGGAWMAVLASAAMACGAGEPPTTSPTGAVVTASVAPNPLSVRACEACGDLPGELEVVGTLTLTETAGVAATVEAVAVQIRSDAGAVFVDGRFDASAVAQLAGGTRLAARGALVVTVPAHFAPAPGRLPATFTATAELRDERGNRVLSGASARITAPMP